MARSLVGKAVVSTALAAAGAAAFAQSAGAAAPRCQDKEGDTIARSSTTRVFQRVRGTIDDGQKVTWFACQLGSRTATHIESYRNDLDAEFQIREALLPSTRYLVVMLEELTGTDDTIVLREYDLTQPDTQLFSFARDGGREGAQVVATRHGGIAFLDGGKLTAFDSAGTQVLVPSGASDLAWGVGGDRIYWTAGGTPASAVLNGHPTGG